jgi:hypothetical protein
MRQFGYVAVLRITEPMTDFFHYRISNPSNPTSTPITCRITHSIPNPKKNHESMIRHLPHSTAAEDKSDGLVSLGFDVIRLKQMAATLRSPPKGSTP